jgi:hypothetical protein
MPAKSKLGIVHSTMLFAPKLSTAAPESAEMGPTTFAPQSLSVTTVANLAPKPTTAAATFATFALIFARSSRSAASLAKHALQTRIAVLERAQTPAMAFLPARPSAAAAQKMRFVPRT